MTNKMEAVMEELNDGEKKIKNYVLFILDRSSSMETIRSEAVDAFNRQIKDTKKALEGKDHLDVEVSLVTFSTRVDTPEIWCRPLDEIKPITTEDFVPSGWTAMYDAIGYAISRIQEQPDINEDTTSVLVIIVSDGGENNSIKFNATHISTMVKEMEDTKRWTIVYEGANIDLKEVRQSTGLSAGNSLLFDASNAGMHASGQSRAVATSNYYASQVSAVNTLRSTGSLRSHTGTSPLATLWFYTTESTTGIATEEQSPVEESTSDQVETK
jgi:uncharacterized protein YegL